MRALVLRGGQVAFDAARAEPRPGLGDVVVRVRLAGICGTDLAMRRGYRGADGLVPGHEFVGVVEDAQGATGLDGRRVVAEINVVCGSCDACVAGRRTHCAGRAALGIFGRDGAFAERVAVPGGNLHVVPDSVPDDAAVFAEPLAAAARVAEQTRVGPGVRAVVVGDGRLGVLVAQVLANEGAGVTVLGRHAERAPWLARRGVAHVTDAASVAPGADVVVEAAGSAGALATAASLVRPEGTLVVKTTCAGDGARAFDWNRLVVDEITVIGSRCGPMDRALELLGAGAVDVAPLVTARFPLERGAEALDAAARPGALKILLETA